MAFEEWDTDEVINWASGTDEALYTKCDQIAKAYKDKPKSAAHRIKNAILGSGILKGTGVRKTKVDWQKVADSFLESV